jgi:hypothetical protein
MTDRTEPERPQDEEGASPEAQAGIRSDIGASGDAPKEEATGDPEDVSGAYRTARGSGEEAGYGQLGTSTSADTVTPEADR